MDDFDGKSFFFEKEKRSYLFFALKIEFYVKLAKFVYVKLAKFCANP